MISKEAFEKAILPVTLRFEGGYANIPGDKGGETYCGISRKHNPGWAGWPVLDQYQPLKRGDMINDAKLKSAVAELYYTKYFAANQFHKFRALPAIMLFDFAVHGGYSPEYLQQLLNNRFGGNLKLDGVIGEKTIAFANQISPVLLSHAILDWRKLHLSNILDRYPSQEKFAQGWENRILYLRKLIDANKDYELV